MRKGVCSRGRTAANGRAGVGRGCEGCEGWERGGLRGDGERSCGEEAVDAVGWTVVDGAGFVLGRGGVEVSLEF